MAGPAGAVATAETVEVKARIAKCWIELETLNPAFELVRVLGEVVTQELEERRETDKAVAGAAQLDPGADADAEREPHAWETLLA